MTGLKLVLRLRADTLKDIEWLETLARLLPATIRDAMTAERLQTNRETLAAYDAFLARGRKDSHP